MNRYAEPFARALAVFVRELDPSSGPAAAEDEGFEDLDDRMVARAVGERMRMLMRERGVTQADLAERVGVSTGVIARALKNPDRAKLSTLRSIAGALDARFADLLR